MKKLTKQFIVVYNNNKIVVKSTTNSETFVGNGNEGVEFDSNEELEEFIEQNNLTDPDEPATTY